MSILSITLKQTTDVENALLEQDKVIRFPLKPSDLAGYVEYKNKVKYKVIPFLW